MENEHRPQRSLTIDGTLIADHTGAYVIAEIGHNHQGSVEKAKELFEEAKRCGANAVKLQKRDNRTLYTSEFFHKPYENENSFGATYGEHREALEFGRSEYEELIGLREGVRHHLLRHGLRPARARTSSPSSTCRRTRSPPPISTNTPLLRHVAEIGKPMIISTGASTLDDVLPRVRDHRSRSTRRSRSSSARPTIRPTGTSSTFA